MSETLEEEYPMKCFVKAKTVLCCVLLGTAAFAQNVHLKPPNSTPSFFDNGLTLTSSGFLAGLGNGDILVELFASAQATAVCTNPAGATQPPGQNPAPATVAGQEPIPSTEIKNGTTSFSVTTRPPTSPIPGAPDCPNPNWTETITDLKFTLALVEVEQPVGTEVFAACFSLSGPSGTMGKVTATSVDLSQCAALEDTP
jgi:hypothetical protein